MPEWVRPGETTDEQQRGNRTGQPRRRSYLALTHMGSDLLDEETHDGLEGMQDRMMRRRFISRTREQVARFFADTDLVEPGLVRVEEWRAGPAVGTTDRSPLWCAVGRKR